MTMSSYFKNVILAYSTPFEYYFGSPRKLPDGTFAKGKIYIEEK